MGPTKENPAPLPANPLDKVKKSRKRPAKRSPILPQKKRICKRRLNLHSEQEKEAADILLNISNSGHQSSMNTENNLHSSVRENIKSEVLKNDNNCFRYTGFPSVLVLMTFFDWLKPFANFKVWNGSNSAPGIAKRRRKRKLALFEEFLFTLIRIRRGYDLFLIAFLFGVTQSYACKLFTSWVKFLHLALSPLILWPSKEIVQANMPESFKLFPRTRCIIDCTEYFVQKPFRPQAQRQTWSMYKHANTFKQLVGISPNGTFTFLSDIFSGSTSDLQIVQKSNFINKVEDGDDIMADRGFNIRHLLLQKKATLNIPAFSHGRNLSSKATKRSRKIAKVRIHVERAIRRLKEFRILSGIINMKLRYQVNQLITIAAVISNLQGPLAY